jgi:glycosyltransferase involved in cell wall biosynthesis
MIDVLMATYNGGKYVKEQIESILNQSYEDFRLIISDDCSTDETCKIIKELRKKDKRIILFEQSLNLGVVKNFEFLLEQVTSDYFMFCDQDDIWDKEKIKKSLEKLEQEDADLVYTDLRIIDENENVVFDSYWKQKGFANKIKKYNNFESLFLNNYITGCTMLVKSKFINQTKPHILPLPNGNKYVLHDYWVALIVAEQGKLAYVEEPLINYRQHELNQVGSKTVSSELNSFEEIRNLFIDVKQKKFKTYKDNISRLRGNSLYKTIDEANDYYKRLSIIKNFNFRYWGLFFKLYKYEEFLYIVKNFIILNMPIFGRLAFNIRAKVKGK